MDPMSCLLHEPREARRGNYSIVPFPSISEGVDSSLHPIPGSAGNIGELLHEAREARRCNRTIIGLPSFNEGQDSSSPFLKEVCNARNIEILNPAGQVIGHIPDSRGE